MADDGEVDVLGDFDFKLEVESEIYDANELPSKSANLLPEYTNPPWMLEQGWNLDMDEKSKATIEKMLLEEQQYLSGKSSKPRRNLQSKGRLLNSPGKSASTISPSARRLWSDQEKQMLLKGVEIYGRSWTKIAELIPTRTTLQIKSFANQFLKNKDKDKEKSVSETTSSVQSTPVEHHSDNPLLETLAKVTAAQPTMTVRNIIIPSKGRIPKSTNNNTIKATALKYTSKFTKRKQPSKILHKKSKPQQISDNLPNGHNDITCSNLVANSNLPAINVKTNTINHKVTITSNLTQNLDGFCSLSDTLASKVDDVSEDDDIDIENDDEEIDVNPVLQSRSTSPNSVYEKLVSEANKDVKQSVLLKNCQLESESENADKLDKSVESNNTELEKFTRKFGAEAEIENELLEEMVPNTKDTSVVAEGDKLSLGAIVEGTEKSGNDPVKSPNNIGIKKVPLEKIYINALTTMEGEIIHFPVPESERIVNTADISDEERKVHKDFFENRTSKTPDRYLKIRNYILDAWKKSRPNYLNKTSVRPGLKNCGDVNCIGRVHAYLECVGAINFGCELASYNVPKYQTEVPKKDKMVKEPGAEINVAKLEAMRPRKRKVKDAFGYWIDEKELEGKTIQHSELTEGAGLKPQKQRLIKSGYDPFKLVPCQPFTEDTPAPFHVEIHKTALIVMDIHAHISKTEVIGMLGGKYCREQGKLTVSMATPCNSISTGMQCEMDPVSQTQASEEIRGAGLKVIGWYHSHPVFNPNPSVRDMETQLKFQEWFAKGGANFVGIIVSPYNPGNMSLGSEFNCLTVRESRELEQKCNMLIPYKFDFLRCDGDVSDISNLILTAQDLATSYSSYQNRVDLNSIYRSLTGITCLDKMLASVKLLADSTETYTEEVLESIKKAFVSTETSDQLLAAELDFVSEKFISVKEES